MKTSKILILSAVALSLAACGEHTHSFGEAWKSDDTSHWHECECGEKSNKADHLDTNIDGKCDVCNHDMEVPGPTPTGGEVTKDEWVAAFGLDKTFYFADNYKISMIMSQAAGEMFQEGTIDGNKLKKVSRNGGYELESYYSKEDNAYYQFTKSGDKWKKESYSINPMKDFTVYLEPFENIDSFTYDSESGTYKCASLTNQETPITNIYIKFVNKQVMSAGFDANMGGADTHLEVTIVYGGQTVTLPTVPPVTTYNVSFNGVKCTSNAQASYNEGQEVTIQITPNEGYAYPQEVYVYGGSYSYNKYDGTLKFTINEDTTIYCASFEKPKYYLSAEYNDEVIYSRSELSEDGKELVSTWYYETVDVCTYSYENGRLTNFKEVEKFIEGDVESEFKNYTYENGNIIRVDFRDDEDGTKNFELREYDEYNRITKSVLMWGEEAYNLTTFEYPDNFTCISKYYFEDYDYETEEHFEECFTTIKKVTIDIEHNTKRVDYVESYRSSEEEFTGYEVYTFDTGKLIERLYSDWSAYDIFEYNEYGDMISNITSEYDSDTGEWHEDTKVTIEYNEDRSLKHIESASPVDSDAEHGYFTVHDYVCNENGLIVSEIDKSYQDGDNYYTRNATFEYKELKFDLYDDDQEDRTNINYGRTIGTYDLDFWYGF